MLYEVYVVPDSFVLRLERDTVQELTPPFALESLVLTGQTMLEQWILLERHVVIETEVRLLVFYVVGGQLLLLENVGVGLLNRELGEILVVTPQRGEILYQAFRVRGQVIVLVGGRRFLDFVELEFDTGERGGRLVRLEDLGFLLVAR